MQRSNPLGKRAGGWVEFYHRGDEARRRQCGSTHVGTGKVTSASLPSNRCLIGRLPRRGIARFDPPGDAQRYPYTIDTFSLSMILWRFFHGRIGVQIRKGKSSH